MWEALSAAWQAAFEEAWTAYRNGSIPIGAAITRPDGTLLVRDRNRAAEPDTVNRLTARTYIGRGVEMEMPVQQLAHRQHRCPTRLRVVAEIEHTARFQQLIPCLP